MTKIKPITKYMGYTLMECHERLLLGQDPCNPAETKYCKGLIQRGLLESRQYKFKDGKIKVGFFITHLGIKTLNAITI